MFVSQKTEMSNKDEKIWVLVKSPGCRYKFGSQSLRTKILHEITNIVNIHSHRRWTKGQVHGHVITQKSAKKEPAKEAEKE